MNNSTQTTGHIGKIRPTLMLSLIGIAIASLGLTSCKKGPYIELNGRKLTVSDIQRDKQLGEKLTQLKATIDKQYNAQVQELLQELAHRRMIESEAKEKGVDVSAYLDSVQRQAEAPTDEQVDQFYNQLKESGQLQNAPPTIKTDIRNHLMQQSREAAIQQEVSRLKKKYRYNLPVERATVSIEGEPVRGSSNAKITVVEFSDFECPFCMRAQPTTKALMEHYGDNIRFVFKDFPLDFHANAMGAHIAANCVYREKPDAFWPFFDGIFSPNRDKKTLQTAALRERALSLGVNPARYDACISDPSIEEKINKNIEEGQSLGVSGTPAFFVNGRLISGAVPFDDFARVIDEELAN